VRRSNLSVAIFVEESKPSALFSFLGDLKTLPLFLSHQLVISHKLRGCLPGYAKRLIITKLGLKIKRRSLHLGDLFFGTNDIKDVGGNNFRGGSHSVISCCLKPNASAIDLLLK